MVNLLDIIMNSKNTYFISLRFDDSNTKRWTEIHNNFTSMLEEDYKGYYHETTSFFIVKERSAEIIMDKIKECGANSSIDHALVMNITASDALFLGNEEDYNQLKEFISTVVRV